jgi:hypothetical protein
MVTSRGYIGIQEVLQRAAPLAEWQLKYRPDMKVLRLKRVDYDLIARWPNAGKLQAIPVSYADGKITWQGLELQCHVGPSRYKAPVKL